VAARVPRASAGVDYSKPAPARIYDYMLRGDNHFQTDIQAAERILSAVPEIRDCAWSNRGFHQRAAKWIAERGVRQFIDIGSGLPTVGNTHEVVQKVSPGARVVYVDNDPMVLVHGRALLTSTPEGRTAYAQADLRSPLDILSSPAVQSVLDFGQPIALMLVAVLPFIGEEDQPEMVLKTLLDALPPGSYLAASHITLEHDPEGVGGGQRVYREAGLPMNARDADEFASLAFSGLELVPPGVVLVSEWRPDSKAPRPSPAEVSCYGGVARKP
jgi:S-adenosyl methyltransferase